MNRQKQAISRSFRHRVLSAAGWRADPGTPARRERQASLADGWRTAALALLAAAALAGCASGAAPDAPRTAATRAAEAGRVEVSHADPAGFGEARSNWSETSRSRQAWLDELSRHLARRAGARLAPDQRLEVRITDVQRAGRFEPWRGPQAGSMRIVRDVYPPRIDLDFRLLTDSGVVLRAGHRELRDSGFLMRPRLALDDDALAYEKAVLDDWVDKELRLRTQ